MNIRLLAFAVLLSATQAFAAANIGKPAPDFTLKDLDGRPVKLSDFKGRHVVLEWHNHACPFVMKHYDSGNMQSLQTRYDVKETVWLSINSTNPGHQDYLANEKNRAYLAAKKAAPDAYLPDPEGTVGKEYGARTTPHMYVINPAGTLVYAGAIDDKRSTNLDDVQTAKNFLVVALEESRAGKPVSNPSTTPYGCSVKYR
jgi:peroxiredoxin